MTHGSAFAAWDRQATSLESFHSRNPEPGSGLNAAQLQQLLGFSVLAPSSHNSVPQVYHVDVPGQRVLLGLAREHVLEASDPTGREALASCGAALENLLTAARQYGIPCSWTPERDLAWEQLGPSPTPADCLLGHIDFLPGSLRKQEERNEHCLLTAMLERKTLRVEFDSTVRLPDELVQALQAAARDADTISLSLFQAREDKFAWGKLDEIALKHKLEERAFQVELGHWLLPNEDTLSVRGMRGREFGFDGPLTLELAAQLRGERPMAGDQLAFMARGGRIGLTSSSAVAVLSCRDESPATAIEAGRVFQRLALLAQSFGFAHALHAGVCKVPHARAMSQATLMRGQAPSVIFRLGKPLHTADWQRQHASRPTLDTLLRPRPTWQSVERTPDLSSYPPCSGVSLDSSIPGASHVTAKAGEAWPGAATLLPYA
jgi:hypothetical protein